jgi:phosphate transport system substrate-binding protein
MLTIVQRQGVRAREGLVRGVVFGLLALALSIATWPAAGAATPASNGSGASSGPAPSARLNTDSLDAAGASLDGTGSSFAAPAILTFVNTVGGAPYNLNMNYTSSSSGQGRFEFTNQTTDFAVSDVGYVGSTDNIAPTFPFIFIPITAGGIAFMYNVPGLTKKLQLSSRTACALLTDGIKFWDDSNIAADNPGVALPHVAVVPVTESDSAGTNYVLEEWCIDEQPAIWSSFVQAEDAQPQGAGVPLSATTPDSEWPTLQGGLNTQSTTTVAGDIATSQGAIGAVQVKYATDEPGFGGSDPSKGVALVKNASGAYTTPTDPVDVASALAYATQQSNGTHLLNFNGIGPNVYNPSTYSYLLTPTTGWSPSKGQTMSNFVNYALTLGQQKVATPAIGYASLGLSLEQYGINQVKSFVPGAVSPTAAEATSYACGDLTPTEVQAGQRTPTCGVVNAVAASAGASGGTAKGTTVAAGGGTSGAGSTAHTSAAGSAVGGVGGVNPFISLSGPSGLPNTGADVIPLLLVGTAFLVVGWVGRRRHSRPTAMVNT